MNGDNLDFLVGKLFKTGSDRFNTALNVSFNYYVELFKVALADMAEQVIKRNLLFCLEEFFLCLILTLFNKLAGKALIRYRVEAVARRRRLGKTGYFDRYRRTGALYLLAVFIGHHSYSAYRRTGNDYIAGIKRTVLNKKRSDRTSAFIKARLDDNALRLTVGVGFEFKHFGYEQYAFKQFIDAFVRFRGNRNAYNVAAPFLGDQRMLGELL